MASPRGWKAAGRSAKAAERLAAEVRSEGFECGCEDGHTFWIRRPGESEIIARFNGHPKNESVLKNARRDLRRRGILPGIGGLKKNNVRKERTVAYTGEAGKTATAELVPRLQAALTALGGDTPHNRSVLSERAASIIAFRRGNGNEDVEQFGSTGRGRSSPSDIARESLRGLLDNGATASEKSARRWRVVLDEVERTGVSSNGDVATEASAPVAEEDMVRMPHAELRKKAEDAEERAELAEQVVADIERERDEARTQLADSLSQIDGLRREVETQTGRADKATARAKKAEAKTVKPSDAVRELQGKMRGLAGQAGRANKRVQRLIEENEQAAAQHEKALAKKNAEIARLRDQVVGGMTVEEAHTHGRELLERLEGTDAPEDAIRVQYATALLAELKASNDSPRDWILSRLDALAGLVGGIE